ncbi:MAG: hypothetical protein HAW67_04000 [Endozoicomonadaceae bacterium]|nr:hypothetical protein [Endozoicomonadaceae bacterium]
MTDNENRRDVLVGALYHILLAMHENGLIDIQPPNAEQGQSIDQYISYELQGYTTERLEHFMVEIRSFVDKCNND